MRQARFKTKGTYDIPSDNFSIWPERLVVTKGEKGTVLSRREDMDRKQWIIRGTVEDATREIDAALNWNSTQKYPEF